VLKPSDSAPDFGVGDRSLYEILNGNSVALFFFLKAHTPG
jgi:hypothetical protein